MRISLEQPTLLNTFTNENPADNQSEETQSDTPNFLNFMSQLTSQKSGGEAENVKQGSGDQSIIDDMADESGDSTELTSLMIALGYLSASTETSAPKENEEPILDKTSDLEATLSEAPLPTNPTAANFNKASDDNDAQMMYANQTPATPAATMAKMRQELPMDTTMPAMDTIPMTKPADDLISQKEAMPLEKMPVDLIKQENTIPTQQTMTTALKQEKNKLINHLEIEQMSENNQKPSLPLEKLKAMTLTPEKDKGQLLETQKPLIPTKTFEIKAEQPLDLNTLSQMMPTDDKVTATFQQLGTLIQAKANTELNQSVTQDVLTSPLMGGNQATEKAAYPVSVEVSKAMNNLDINMANYQVNIKIYPPELGKITANLKINKNTTTLEVVAETKEIKGLLQTHMAALKEQFSSANMPLHKVEVILSDEKQGNLERESNGKQDQTPEAYVEVQEENQALPQRTKAKISENAVDAYV